jgi:hypothetical protein
MFIPLNIYFKRLTDALENVVAPEIESDHVRGQVFAVVELIRQIIDRIEYKQDLINQEIELGRNTIGQIADALVDAGVDAPAEIAEFIQSFEEGKAGKGIPLRNKTDEMVCAAMEAFHRNMDKMNPEVAEKTDAAIRENMFKLIGRELGLMKPPMIEKISRSKREKKQ